MGVIKCSHMPDTTKPMANPARPDANPPTNAARRNSPRPVPSMDPSPKKRRSALGWMAAHLEGRLLYPLYCQSMRRAWTVWPFDGEPASPQFTPAVRSFVAQKIPSVRGPPHIRSLLKSFGDGADHLHELKPSPAARPGSRNSEHCGPSSVCTSHLSSP